MEDVTGGRGLGDEAATDSVATQVTPTEAGAAKESGANAARAFGSLAWPVPAWRRPKDELDPKDEPDEEPPADQSVAEGVTTGPDEPEPEAEPEQPTSQTDAALDEPEAETEPEQPEEPEAEPAFPCQRVAALTPVASPSSALAAPAPTSAPAAPVMLLTAGPPASALATQAPLPQPAAAALELRPTVSRRDRARWLIAAAILVLAGGYCALAWWFGQTVPSGATVLGVSIGGLSTDRAADELRDALATRVDDPVKVQVGQAVTTIPPTGLSIDYRATVAQVAGFSLNPADLVRHVAGVGEVEPVIHADRTGVRSALTTVADDVTVPATPGQIAFIDGAVVRTSGADGLRVPDKAAADALTSQWLRKNPVELPTEVVHPDVSEKELDKAEAVAHTVLSGPVIVHVDGRTATLGPNDIAAVARFVQADGALTLTIDGAELDPVIRAQLPDLGSAPVNASAGFVAGQPALIEGTPGTGLDQESLGHAVAAAAASTTDRTATVALADVQPDVTLATLADLGIKEKVSEFATPYPHDPQRTINLTTGAAAVNGTLLKPGEQFSLSDALGRLTTDRGYVASGVVTNGVAEMEVGGGVSQISTTTYNAAYFAGLRLDEHKPHSRYFSRYPEGREATVYYPSVDMKFTNTTPYGILIQAWLADEHVHVAMWSTKVYEVTSDTSARYGFTSPGTVHNSRADCTPQRAGQGGFSVDDTRTIKDLTGKVLSVEKQTTTYAPVNAVICDG